MLVVLHTVIVHLFIRCRVVGAHLHFVRYYGQRPSLRRRFSHLNDCHSRGSVSWPLDILKKTVDTRITMFLALPNDTFWEVSLSLQSIAHPWLLIKVSEESVHALRRYGSRKCLSAAAIFFAPYCISNNMHWLDMRSIYFLFPANYFICSFLYFFFEHGQFIYNTRSR